jgi:hypothetical protein
MMTPDDFYTDKDHPGTIRTNRMWKRISAELFQERTEYRIRFDRKSFLYGVAASFILYFAGLGAAGSIQRYIEQTQPAEVRTDKAYRSAIKEFEQIVLTSETGTVQEGKDDLAALRRIRLQYLNSAIEELRSEMGTNDLSPLKRQRLNRFYDLKLTLLQDMLRQGELHL